MYRTFQGIPNLPDLTHVNELMDFGSKIIERLGQLAIFVLFLGIVIALFNWSFSKNSLIAQSDNKSNRVFSGWMESYFLFLQKLPHILLVVFFLVGGFFLCSTLANRYHNWEQARIATVAKSVSGDRLEQPAPKIRYVVEEPYSYTRWVEGEQVKVEDTRKVNRFLTLAESQIDVTINQTTAADTGSWIYSIDFDAEYLAVNKLQEKGDFFFEIRPPYGYRLLQDFQVEQDGKRLVQINPGDYGFPFSLEAGAETSFRVAYKAVGAPRFTYEPGGQLLSNFRLTVLANFPKADFASGILPTETKEERIGTRFTWVFENNVSVRNPFGVFTATDPVRNTGIMPRLLLLAPALFLWWIMLLYLSVPLRLQDVAMLGGIFFACLLSLTYLSRLIDVKLAWTGISLLLLALVWGLGSGRRSRLAVEIATIAGGVLPVWGLIVSASGLTLSLAGLLSVTWLAARNWYVIKSQ